MKWISVKDRLPDMYVPVLVARRGACSSEGLTAFVAIRIEKEHAHSDRLQERIGEDIKMDFDYWKLRGWIPGACYEWEICGEDGIGLGGGFEGEYKLTLLEITHWMPLPNLPYTEYQDEE